MTPSINEKTEPNYKSDSVNINLNNLKICFALNIIAKAINS